MRYVGCYAVLLACSLALAQEGSTPPEDTARGAGVGESADAGGSAAARQQEMEKAWALYKAKFESGDNHEEVAKEILKDFSRTPLAKDVLFYEACAKLASGGAVLTLVECATKGERECRKRADWVSFDSGETAKADEMRTFASDLHRSVLLWYLCPDETESLLSYDPTRQVQVKVPERRDDPRQAGNDAGRGERRRERDANRAAQPGRGGLEDYLSCLMRGALVEARSVMKDGEARRQLTQSYTAHYISTLASGNRWARIQSAYDAASSEQLSFIKRVAELRGITLLPEPSAEQEKANMALITRACQQLVEKGDKYEEGFLEARRMLEAIREGKPFK